MMSRKQPMMSRKEPRMSRKDLEVVLGAARNLTAEATRAAE